MNDRTPQLSIVICTHNRAEDALECCQALLSAPDAAHTELLVVDNCSRHEDARRLSDGLAGTGAQLLLEPRAGLSHARNHGLARARGEWIAYLDDDALPFDDWTARALSLLQGAPEVLALIGGAVLPRWPRTIAADAVAPEHLGERWRVLLSLLETEQRPRGSQVPNIVGCNFLVRRRALRELGGFATELGRTPERLLGGEEIAIARAIAARGERIEFDSGLRVFHKISNERLHTSWIKKRAAAEGELLWKCAPSALPKVAMSIPFLALAAHLRGLGAGTPSDYDHHVRLWHNLGFLESALGALTTKPSRSTPCN
ncbi:MAG: glycosyltransferase family 2 protein [Polyangiaceae bacterium]